MPSADLTPIALAAARAPHAAGVYFLLGRRHELLYVGMAKDLRRRLQQHANAPRYPLYRRTAHVRWEELPDEDTAAAREADLIVALQPPYNASIAGHGKWAYIHVGPAHRTGDRLRFAISKEITARDGVRAYGCFPHLGAGVGSRPGIDCSDGYCGFLRLLWAASGEGQHFPGRVTRGSPLETFDVAVDPALAPSLHSFLSGTSRRVLVELGIAASQRERYMQPGIARDRDLAEAFFVAGPVALRTFRRRHALSAAPVSQRQFEDLISGEVRAIIGAADPSRAAPAQPAIMRAR